MGKRARRLIGIDLGTTHTVVAWADPTSDAPPEVFAIPALSSATEIDARPLLPTALYAPLEGERFADPWGDAPFVLGALAQRRGGEVPGRLVASAKSWLCHPGVDRTAAILPWGVAEDAIDVPRISPVSAATRVLSHVRRAWDAAYPDHALELQDVVLTVPASFDEVARELTVQAASAAGIGVRLLEEPQAAFYDLLRKAGPERLAALLDETGEGALVLVVDIGGGTTDLSLIRVDRAGDGGGVELTRVAVGNHLLLGGDNMDLALAHLCEPHLVATKAEGQAEGDERPRLDAGRFAQLVLACRAAKERLLGDEPPHDAPITLLSRGARLVGGARTTRLARDEVERVVLDGFFPIVDRAARPARTRSALVAFGLPYEKDAAITRHIAAFFARHAPLAKGPRGLLLNGGVFRAPAIARRLAEAIAAWGGPPLDVLPHGDPDVSVARGAVAYGLSLLGRGPRIEGGAPRGYYVGVAAERGQRRAVCVVPRGAKEGERHVVSDRPLTLLVDRPVRFDLYASDGGAVHAPGEVVTIDEDGYAALPPLAAVIPSNIGPAATKGARAKGREVRVALHGELTAIGTLELACVELDGPPGEEASRHRLAFQLRDPGSGDEAPTGEVAVSKRPLGRRLDEAKAALDKVFGRPKEPAEPREVKGLVRELERVLGEREKWQTDLLRDLFDALAPNLKSRRRSADHERVFWQVAGYCLRPGFGHPLDAQRVALVAPLFADRLAFPQEARSWPQLWIAFRRVAGGLDEATQTAIRDFADPFLAPTEKRLKKPKGVKPESLDLLLELASSLERVPAQRKGELGAWLLERTWTDRDPRLRAALGRLGSRVPAYASMHYVVSPQVAERWLDHLLREKWDEHPASAEASVRLARVTDDRARDVSERVRREVARKLEAIGAKEAWVRAVREHVPVEDADRSAFFGEDLPVGLRLSD